MPHRAALHVYASSHTREPPSSQARIAGATDNNNSNTTHQPEEQQRAPPAASTEAGSSAQRAPSAAVGTPQQQCSQQQQPHLKQQQQQQAVRERSHSPPPPPLTGLSNGLAHGFPRSSDSMGAAATAAAAASPKAPLGSALGFNAEESTTSGSDSDEGEEGEMSGHVSLRAVQHAASASFGSAYRRRGGMGGPNGAITRSSESPSTGHSARPPQHLSSGAAPPLSRASSYSINAAVGVGASSSATSPLCSLGHHATQQRRRRVSPLPPAHAHAAWVSPPLSGWAPVAQPPLAGGKGSGGDALEGSNSFGSGRGRGGPMPPTPHTEGPKALLSRFVALEAASSPSSHPLATFNSSSSSRAFGAATQAQPLWLLEAATLDRDALLAVLAEAVKGLVGQRSAASAISSSSPSSSSQHGALVGFVGVGPSLSSSGGRSGGRAVQHGFPMPHHAFTSAARAPSSSSPSPSFVPPSSPHAHERMGAAAAEAPLPFSAPMPSAHSSDEGAAVAPPSPAAVTASLSHSFVTVSNVGGSSHSPHTNASTATCRLDASGSHRPNNGQRRASASQQQDYRIGLVAPLAAAANRCGAEGCGDARGNSLPAADPSSGENSNFLCGCGNTTNSAPTAAGENLNPSATAAASTPLLAVAPLSGVFAVPAMAASAETLSAAAAGGLAMPAFGVGVPVGSASASGDGGGGGITLPLGEVEEDEEGSHVDLRMLTGLNKRYGTDSFDAPAGGADERGGGAAETDGIGLIVDTVSDGPPAREHCGADDGADGYGAEHPLMVARRTVSGGGGSHHSFSSISRLPSGGGPAAPPGAAPNSRSPRGAGMYGFGCPPTAAVTVSTSYSNTTSSSSTPAPAARSASTSSAGLQQGGAHSPRERRRGHLTTRLDPAECGATEGVEGLLPSSPPSGFTGASSPAAAHRQPSPQLLHVPTAPGIAAPFSPHGGTSPARFVRATSGHHSGAGSSPTGGGVGAQASSSSNGTVSHHAVHGHSSGYGSSVGPMVSGGGGGSFATPSTYLANVPSASADAALCGREFSIGRGGGITASLSGSPSRGTSPASTPTALAARSGGLPMIVVGGVGVGGGTTVIRTPSARSRGLSPANPSPSDAITPTHADAPSPAAVNTLLDEARGAAPEGVADSRGANAGADGGSAAKGQTTNAIGTNYEPLPAGATVAVPPGTAGALVHVPLRLLHFYQDYVCNRFIDSRAMRDTVEELREGARRWGYPSAETGKQCRDGGGGNNNPIVGSTAADGHCSDPPIVSLPAPRPSPPTPPLAGHGGVGGHATHHFTAGGGEHNHHFLSSEGSTTLPPQSTSPSVSPPASVPSLSALPPSAAASGLAVGAVVVPPTADTSVAAEGAAGGSDAPPLAKAHTPDSLPVMDAMFWRGRWYGMGNRRLTCYHFVYAAYPNALIPVLATHVPDEEVLQPQGRGTSVRIGGGLFVDGQCYLVMHHCLARRGGGGGSFGGGGIVGSPRAAGVFVAPTASAGSGSYRTAHNRSPSPASAAGAE